jgi:hypothetical protein
VAYPILTSIYRIQAILKGPSGLPTDCFINTWYFENEGGPTSREAYVVRMTEILDGFYNDVHAPAAAAVKQFIPNGIVDVEYKAYDLGEAPPRFPIMDPIAASWSGAGNQDPFPREVACCLSFKGGNGPRKRGRIYLGPLSNDAAALDVTDESVTVSTPLQEALASAASWMITKGTDGSGPDVWWVQVSPTDGAFNRVTEGFVDNAFDTVRSRGREPSARVRFDDTGLI